MVNKNIKRVLVVVMATLLIISLLVGCTKPVETTKEKDSINSSEDEKIDTSKDTIRMAIDREPASLDSAIYVTSWTCQDQIYEGLVAYELDGNIVPCLAESFEQVDDVTWKFKLREDVYFHNGEHMTSADVLYSFKRAMSYPQAAAILSNLDPESFEAPDDYTFILKTRTPFAFVLENLCETYLSVINQKAVEDAGSPEEYGRAPIGTGAYKFVSWNPGDRITLTRNDKYWGEKAKVENVILKIITENATRTIDLESGGCDINWLVSIEDYDRIANNGDTTLVMYSSGSFDYFPLNVGKDYFADKRVRQAFQYATDREVIWREAFGEEISDFSSGPIAPGISGRNENIKPYEYNPEKAKALLAEAGYPDGLESEFLMFAGSPDDIIATLLKEQWADVGIKLNLKVVDSALINSLLNEGNYYSGYLTARVQPMDAGFIMWKLFHSSNHGASNRSYIKDKELDAILDEIMVTFDKTKRDELAIKAQEMVNELACVISICHKRNLNGLRSNVRGYEASGYRRPLLKKVYFIQK